MRNALVHGYITTNATLVWDTYINDLPLLKSEYCRRPVAAACRIRQQEWPPSARYSRRPDESPPRNDIETASFTNQQPSVSLQTDLSTIDVAKQDFH